MRPYVEHWCRRSALAMIVALAVVGCDSQEQRSKRVVNRFDKWGMRAIRVLASQAEADLFEMQGELGQEFGLLSSVQRGEAWRLVARKYLLEGSYEMSNLAFSRSRECRSQDDGQADSPEQYYAAFLAGDRQFLKDRATGALDGNTDAGRVFARHAGMVLDGNDTAIESMMDELGRAIKGRPERGWGAWGTLICSKTLIRKDKQKATKLLIAGMNSYGMPSDNYSRAFFYWSVVRFALSAGQKEDAVLMAREWLRENEGIADPSWNGVKSFMYCVMTADTR